MRATACFTDCRSEILRFLESPRHIARSASSGWRRSIARGRDCTRLFIHSGIYPRGQLIIPNQARLRARSRFNNVAISRFNTGISSARRESALLRVNDLRQRSLMSERERALPASRPLMQRIDNNEPD